jgi:hypothetical protein
MIIPPSLAVYSSEQFFSPLHASHPSMCPNLMNVCESNKTCTTVSNTANNLIEPYLSKDKLSHKGQLVKKQSFYCISSSSSEESVCLSEETKDQESDDIASLQSSFESGTAYSSEGSNLAEKGAINEATDDGNIISLSNH